MAFAEENGYDGMEDIILDHMMNVDYGIWITRYNREIKISDMTTTHITNSIKMITRSMKSGKNWRVEYLPQLIIELNKRKNEIGKN